MFFTLDTKDFKKILPLYLGEEIIFPLILAVIQQQQRGWVFVDDLIHPTSAMVINNFGFMQFIGNSKLTNNLDKFFKNPTARIPSYLLWYAPPLQIQKALDNFTKEQVRRRERARFIFQEKNIKSLTGCPAGFTVQRLDKELLMLAENFKLDISSRFWESMDDFLNHGIGTCVTKDGVIVSLCYSACIVDNLTEIDVFTQAEYRGFGLATIAAQNFISECLYRGITPTWDCFVNNDASMKLAKLLGFKQTVVYPFYSFNLPINISSSR